MAFKRQDSGFIELSPTKIGRLKECPRCFWLLNNKHIKKLPEGISAGLPKGIDRTLKEYFDRFRGSLPPDIAGKVPGVLFQDLSVLKRWRYWDGGLHYIDKELGVRVSGALDDCLIDDDVLIPIDYKTKASEEAASRGDGEKYYQTQLDFYCLFLQTAGHKVDGRAFLCYYFPVEVSVENEAEALMSKGIVYNFGSLVYPLKCDTERARQIVRDAVAILRGPMPDPGFNEKGQICSYCEFGGSYQSIVDKIKVEAVG